MCNENPQWNETEPVSPGEESPGPDPVEPVAAGADSQADHRRRRRKGTLPPVLFEDAAIIAFDKPAGLLVAPDRWKKSTENLMDIVHQRLSPGIFNAHRLDRETSGVLVCAKTRATLKKLVREFEKRAVSKQYVALIHARPEWEETTVNLALAPSAAEPGRMRTVAEGGKPAEPRFEVLERWRNYSLVRAMPLTGRTHQIRVHLASIACPVVGDAAYGDGHGIMLSRLKPNYRFKADTPERPLIGRVALHAESIAFTHPESGVRFTVHSPLPHDFTVAIKYLDRFGR